MAKLNFLFSQIALGLAYVTAISADKADLFSGATNRLTVRTLVVVGRTDAAVVAEDQVISAIVIRRTRPIIAVVTYNVEGAIVRIKTARGRVPALGARGEISLEVHSTVR